MLQGQRDLTVVGRLLLSELAPLVGAHQGVIYQVDTEERQPALTPPVCLCSRRWMRPIRPDWSSAKAWSGNAPSMPAAFSLPTSQITSCRSVPPCSPPSRRAPSFCRFMFEGQVKAVIELSSAGEFTDLQLSFLDQLTTSHRHRAQLDRSDDADRRPAEAIPAAGD